MKIRLNVATQPLESHRRFIAGSVVLGLVGLVALVVLSTSVVRALRENRGQRAEISGYRDQLAQMETQRRQLSSFFDSPQTKTVVDRATFLNSLIDQRTFPWTKIFTDLEKVLPAGVRVVSIAPQMRKGEVDVKLAVGAMSTASANAFLKALQSSPAFSQLRVRDETRTQGNDQQDQLLIQLEAVYSGASEDP
jgi:Tfp pilus assembly protein PilN